MNKVDLREPEQKEKPKTVMLSRQAFHAMPQGKLMELLQSNSKVFLIGNRMMPVRLTLATLD